MKWNRMGALACLMALSAVVAAQEAPRLLFEVTVDGKVIARPEMRVPVGGEGRLSLNNDPYRSEIVFTPTLRDDQVALALAQ